MTSSCLPSTGKAPPKGKRPPPVFLHTYLATQAWLAARKPLEPRLIESDGAANAGGIGDRLECNGLAIQASPSTSGVGYRAPPVSPRREQTPKIGWQGHKDAAIRLKPPAWDAEVRECWEADISADCRLRHPHGSLKRSLLADAQLRAGESHAFNVVTRPPPDLPKNRKY